MLNTFRNDPRNSYRATSKHSRRHVFLWLLVAGLTTVGGVALAVANNPDRFVPRFEEFLDPDGRFANLNLGGPTDTTKNAFFEDIGTNSRRCVTCHQASDAWSVTPKHIQARFAASRGTDPIFRPNDGSGCPTQDTSTEDARREAYSLLLNKGLIRIELPVPANAEFTVMNS